MGRPTIPNKPKETQVRIFIEDKRRHKALLADDMDTQAKITHHLLDCYDELKRLKKTISEAT